MPTASDKLWNVAWHWAQRHVPNAVHHSTTETRVRVQEAYIAGFSAVNARIIAVLREVEAALGENLVWISDVVDQRVRQKDAETLRKLAQLNTAWQAVAKLLHDLKK